MLSMLDYKGYKYDNEQVKIRCRWKKRRITDYLIYDLYRMREFKRV